MSKTVRVAVKAVCIVLFCLLFTTSCGNTDSQQLAEPLQQSLTLRDLLDIAYERRQGIYPPDDERLEELTHGRVPHTINLRTEHYLQLHPGRLRISYQDAKYDAQLFFDILRQVYGGYIYFGGDNVFMPIFDGILEKLASRETWVIDHFAELLHTSLNPYIHDGHVIIGYINFMGSFQSDYSVYASHTVFDRTENGFRNRDNGLYVKDVVGYDKDDIFRLTVSEYGELTYTAVITGQYDSGTTLTIIYKNDESEEMPFDLLRGTRPRYQEPSLDFVDGFPIVTIDRMYFEHVIIEDIENANTFLSFVDELRDEPAIIIDLRGNPGGNAFLAPRWLYRLVGEHVVANGVQLIAEDYDFAMWRRGDSPGALQPPCEIREREVYTPLSDRHAILHRSDPANFNPMVSNDKIIIFLTGRHTFSAAEDFVDMAFNMENTIVIGQNTGGALFTNMCFPIRYLPNSGVVFGLGASMRIHAEAHNFREGVGFAPDLWVPHQDDALPAALALLRNHFADGE